MLIKTLDSENAKFLNLTAQHLQISFTANEGARLFLEPPDVSATDEDYLVIRANNTVGVFRTKEQAEDVLSQIVEAYGRGNKVCFPDYPLS